MLQMNKAMTNPKDRPVKVVQFGEGNFLRGFVDYMIDIANEKGLFDGSVVLIKPIEFGNLENFHKQDCQYTHRRRRSGSDGRQDVVLHYLLQPDHLV